MQQTDKNWISELGNVKGRGFGLYKSFDIDLSNKVVLDYGAAHGILKNELPESATYFGVDCIAEYANYEKNIKHYNIQHPTYNPEGVSDLDIKTVFPEQKFDVIIASSVFNHHTYDSMVSCIDNLKTVLNDDGFILFSIWDKAAIVKWHAQLKENNSTDIDWVNDNIINHAYWYKSEGTQYIDYDKDLQNTPDDNLMTFYNTDWLIGEKGYSIHRSQQDGIYRNIILKETL